jgi:hypothetical protein
LHHATGAPIPAFVRTRFDREVSALRATLGEEKFNAGYAEGKSMAMEQAVAHALENVDLDKAKPEQV